jgi:hypothetical protein
LNPARPLAWRWQLAGALARSSGRRSRRRWIDASVGAAVRYLRAADRRRVTPGSRRPSVEPALDAAVRLGHGADQKRLEIEDRLLAGQDDATIAARTGLAAAAIRSFAERFFDVRPRLACPEQLLFATIGAALYESSTPIPAEVVRRLLCMRGGPAVADALLDPVAAPAWAPRLERLGAVLGLRVNRQTSRRVLDLLDRLEEVERLRAARLAATSVVITPSGDVLVALLAQANDELRAGTPAPSDAGPDRAGEDCPIPSAGRLRPAV